MKGPLALLSVGLLSACIAACGSASKETSSHTSSSAHTDTTTGSASLAPAPVQSAVDADKDNDLSAPYDDKSNDSLLSSGHRAGPSEARAITALLKRYYAAAAAENGLRACAMLYSTLAEAVAEDYGQSPPGPPYMKGTTCPAVLRMAFGHFHPQIALELPKLEVAHVRLVEGHGLVVLRFGALPERQIAVRRERHTWKLATLLDSELP
jgi:hypothetical protein